jgi:hypothetical protein
MASHPFYHNCEARNTLLHEDNSAVVATLTKLNSRSLAMMTELRHRLWYLLDNNDICIRPRYIYLAAITWAIR